MDHRALRGCSAPSLRCAALPPPLQVNALLKQMEQIRTGEAEPPPIAFPEHWEGGYEDDEDFSDEEDEEEQAAAIGSVDLGFFSGGPSGGSGSRGGGGAPAAARRRGLAAGGKGAAAAAHGGQGKRQAAKSPEEEEVGGLWSCLLGWQGISTGACGGTACLHCTPGCPASHCSAPADVCIWHSNRACPSSMPCVPALAVCCQNADIPPAHPPTNLLAHPPTSNPHSCRRASSTWVGRRVRRGS